MRKSFWPVVMLFFILTLQINASYKLALSQFYKGNIEAALETLSTVSAKKNPEKHVLTALCHLELNNPDKGIQSLNKYKAKSFERPYLTYIHGRLQIKKNATDQFIKSDHYIQQTVDKPFLIQRLRLDLVNYLQKKKNWKETDTIIHLIEGNPTNPFINSLRLKKEIEIGIQTYDRKKALRKYEELISNHPESDIQQKLWKRIQKTWQIKAHFYTNFKSIKDHLRYSQNALRTKQYQEVIRHHSYVVKNYPDHPLLYRFHFDKGLSYYHLGKFNLAALELNRFVDPIITQKDPDYILVQFYLGVSLSRLNKFKLALTHLENVIALGPSPYYNQAIYEALHLTENNDLKYYHKYEKLFETTQKNTPFYHQYHWEKNWGKHYTLPPNEINKFLTTQIQPSIKEKLIHWYQQKFPYASPSKAILQGFHSLPISYRSHQAVLGLTGSPKAQLNLDKAFSKEINHIVKLGLRPLLIEELTYNANQRSVPNINNIYHLSRLYIESGKYSKGLNIIQSGFQSLNLSLTEAPRPFLRLMYPKLYWGHIQKYSKAHKVDPYLVLAFIREISFFDTQKKGSRDKRGLLQLTINDGKKLAFRLGEYWTGSQKLYDPRINIKLGTFHLGWLVKQFGNNIHYISAAMHTSHETARIWAKSKQNHQFAAFKEQIPYLESRQFIQHILDSYIIYKLVDDPKLKDIKKTI